MPRPRKPAPEAPAEGQDPQAPAPESAAQMSVQIKGDPAAVKKNLAGVPSEPEEEGDDQPRAPKGTKRPGRRDVPRTDDFVDALQDPNHIVVVRRVKPREFNGEKADVEVYRDQCPMPLSDLEEEIRGFGGKRYRAAVVDPRSNEQVAVRILGDYTGDPVLPKPEGDPATTIQLPENLGQDPSAADILTESLDREAKLAAKEFELEQARARLNQFRQQQSGRIAEGKGIDPQTLMQMSALERQVANMEAKAQAERQIEEFKAAQEERMRELETKAKQAADAKPDALAPVLNALVSVINRPQPAAPDTATPVLGIITKMMEDSNRRFEVMMQQLQNQQIGQLQQSIERIAKTPVQQEGSTLLEAVKVVREIQEMSGSGDDDDDDDGDDDRHWLQVLVEDHVPKVIKMFEDRSVGGKPMSQAEVMAEINKAAEKAAGEVTAGLRAAPPLQGLPAPAAPALPPPPFQTPAAGTTQAVPRALPAPPPPAAVPAAPPAAAAPPQPPVGAPPAAAATAPSAPPAPVRPEQAAEQAAMTIEAEIAKRVGVVLAHIAKEMLLRPRQYEWTAVAWQDLPEEVLGRMCSAKDPVAMIGAFDGLVNPVGLSEFKARLSADPKSAAFIQRGLNDLSAWWDQLQKDPNFDPLTEEEPEETE